RLYRAQGAHIMHAADVDDDGRDEVIIGSAVIDDNGVGLWSTGYGHPDYCFVGDIDPSRPGLEIFYGVEPPRKNHALCLVEAKTGKVIWGLEEATNHVGTSGMCADIDPRHPGLECYAADIDRERKYAQGWYYSATGEILAKGRIGSVSSNAYWDADPQREVIQGPRIRDFQGAIHPPTVSGRFITVADVLGDWREEIIMSVAGELRIYST
ncbi:MAG: silent information regulator protein Sir2, partial [Victivallales bacterium]|nr:silent information regulator protein Sir2 [Victivallales bacterium]